jgi:predicted phage tail protein
MTTLASSKNHRSLTSLGTTKNQFGKKRTEYLDLYDIGYGDDFTRYGAETIDVDLVGCTSQAEARRHGRWLLATGRLESKTVLFATGDEGRVRKPSDLIQLFDAHEQGARYAGRVLDATTIQIVLDDDVTIAGGDKFVVMIDGIEHTRDVVNPAGSYTQNYPRFAITSRTAKWVCVGDNWCGTA